MYTYKSNKENIEECFYDSSNIFYTKLEDIPNELKKLTVVFKNGSQYLYKDVDVMEYVRFRDSESTGKAFASIISTKVNGQPRFQYVRLSDANMDELNARLEEIKQEQLNEIKQERTDEECTTKDVKAIIVQTENELQVSLKNENSDINLRFELSDADSIARLLMWLKIDYSFSTV